MSIEKKQYIRSWLAKANEDLKVSLVLIKDEMPLTSPICFHCQQAVEKFFKAFLATNGVDFPKTHDVDYLLELCKKININLFENIDTLDLNLFSVDIRYPGDEYNPNLAETKNYIALANQIKGIVEQEISKSIGNE